ncbi:kelch domain-containing protein 7A [Pogona vitticeps]
MIPGAEGNGDQLSEMQLAGRWALSAAALLLLTLAYRYYKSRGSPDRPQEGARGAAKATQGREPSPLPVCNPAEREDTPQGLRHRGVRRTGSEANGRTGKRSMEPGGLAARGTFGLKGAPAGREAEEEEQTREEEEGHLGPGSQADRQRLAPQAVENQEARTPWALLGGARVTDGMAGMTSESRWTFRGLCSQAGEGGTSVRDRKGPGPGAGSGEAGLCLPLGDCQQAGRGPQRTSGGDESALSNSWRPSLRRGEGHPDQAEETQLQRERDQPFPATAGLGLAMSPSCRGSSAAYTFSAVAETRVQESLPQAAKSKERNSGQAEPPRGDPRGCADDHCVQPMSQSVTKEKSSYTCLDTPQSYDIPSTETPCEPEMQLQWDVADTVSENGEGGVTAEKAAPTSPGASEKETKSMQPEGQKGAAAEGNPTQKPPGPRYGISRKESFHKIIENPELQVPMEGFGSPVPESSERDSPPLVPLCSGSISSLSGSMKSIPSDTSEEPTVELVAGAKFLRFPLCSETSADVVHLDLGNCYEVLRMAKQQKLEALREAAYKVMSDNYLQVLRTNAIYGRLNAMERDLILRKRMQGRKFLAVADVSSQEHGGHASRLCYYDDRKDTWRPLTHLPMEAVSKGCAVCSMFNYLFVAAGCEGRGRLQRPSSRVLCYNPLTHIWREICPLNQARPHCKLVALDGCLYAIGGECLSTVERYDPRTDRWSFTAPLPNDTFAVAHTAAACDGEIYVTGGTLRYMLLRYVPRLDAWKVSLTGGSKDRTTEMVAAGGFLYRFDLNRSRGISVYRCSAKAKLWYECATHPVPFPACFQCTVVENLVYCVGRQFHLRFLTDHISPRFGTKEIQLFPSPRGTLFPMTLMLPERDVAQTRV